MLLHAITTPPDCPPPPGVVTFERDGLTLWGTTAVGPFTKDQMLEHHRVVTEICTRVAACLPLRFPTVTEDPASVDLLAYAERLERVRDACELAVTAVWLDTSSPETGRAYLLRRVRAERIADELEAAMGDALLDALRTLCPSPKAALSLAALVRRDLAETVKSRIPRNAEDVRILVNGPWPPYTFADRPRLGTRNASA